MKVSYKPSFIKDLRRIKGCPEYNLIRRLCFEEMPLWTNLSGHGQIKRLATKDRAYRLRVGDYRIGFFHSDNSLELARVLHRREIYRFFP